ncbi:hypothetical protein G7Y89_g8578 [Cudoniella acicularis]|uniref:FAD-binding domain-containing protein n=1 Tax=Cudoniella acicularis TaxID=354080 RepID=A0A8H4W3F3_9HELO|nr:hypothetical protein G7Y89_g8578 [Cudoniella acicularis]
MLRSPSLHLLEHISSSKRLKIGIIGAAVAGPVLALHILTHPTLSKIYQPILYDRSPDPRSSHSEDEKALQTAGAAVAIGPNGLYPLYQLGLRDAMEKMSCDFSGGSFWRSRTPLISLKDGEDVRNAVRGEWRFLNRASSPTWSEGMQSSMRIIERRHLQSLLLEKVQKLGGEVKWESKLENIESFPNRKPKVSFRGKGEVEFDLLVGADGSWSEIRRHILKQRNLLTAPERWIPDFMGACGFYGISTLQEQDLEKFDNPDIWSDTHGVWLDQGNLSTSPLPGSKIRWDLIIPQKLAPEPSKMSQEEENTFSDHGYGGWESKIAPGAYPRSESIEILRKHAGIFHPVTGTFGKMLSRSERIIRSPLRQGVWTKDEIQDWYTKMRPPGSGFAIEDAIVLANSLFTHPPSISSHSPSTSTTPNFIAALSSYATTRLPRSQKMAKVAYYAGHLGVGERWYWRLLRDYGTAWMPKQEDLKL